MGGGERRSRPLTPHTLTLLSGAGPATEDRPLDRQHPGPSPPPHTHSMTAARATVFILPVHRRAWLWHARLDAAAGDAPVGAAASSSSSALSPAAPRPRWQDGATLEDKVELAGDQLAAWVSDR